MSRFLSSMNTASLGIAGLTLGFAARGALSNVISGLLIFWDRPFVTVRRESAA